MKTFSVKKGILEATTILNFKNSLDTFQFPTKKADLIDTTRRAIYEHLVGLSNKDLNKIATKLAFRIVDKTDCSFLEIKENSTNRISAKNEQYTVLAELLSSGQKDVKKKNKQNNTFKKENREELYDRLYKTNSSALRQQLRESHVLKTEPSFCPSTPSKQDTCFNFTERQTKVSF